MRLTEKEQKAILSAVLSKDKGAEIYLFGSRTKDKLRGGDIDLLVISDSISFSEKVDILIDIKNKIGEQKIDLLIKTNQEASKDAFVKSILNEAVRLPL